MLVGRLEREKFLFEPVEEEFSPVGQDSDALSGPYSGIGVTETLLFMPGLFGEAPLDEQSEGCERVTEIGGRPFRRTSRRRSASGAQGSKGRLIIATEMYEGFGRVRPREIGVRPFCLLLEFGLEFFYGADQTVPDARS